MTHTKQDKLKIISSILSVLCILLMLFIFAYIYLNAEKIYDTMLVKHPCDICEESYKQVCSNDMTRIFGNIEKTSWTERHKEGGYQNITMPKIS